MPGKPADIFKLLNPIVARRPVNDPWVRDGSGSPRFQSDHDLLAEMLAVPIGEGAKSQSGRLAKSVDAWVAAELRRAGFTEDEVWPRIEPPRVLPYDIAKFIAKLPQRLRDEAWDRLLDNKTVAPAEARVLGRAYTKQVDVLIAHWSRGVELLVSTKTMESSSGKNWSNRFEEAYGDAKNLRGRFPLAAMGFLFVLNLTELALAERIADMMRKLKAENDVYDTTCLLVVDWGDNGARPIRVVPDLVPEDLSSDTFMAALVECVLKRTPLNMHVKVRELYEHRDLRLAEAEPGSDSQPDLDG